MTSQRSFLPSIWIADFTSKGEFDTCFSMLKTQLDVMAKMDDRMIHSRYPFKLKAWCSVCNEVTEIHVDWHYAGTSIDGAIHPAWTETCACITCGLNSRMRALVDCLVNKLKLSPESKIYMAEQVTPAFKIVKKLFGNVTGSEYLGAEYRPGEKAFSSKRHFGVRHEDFCNLSFSNNVFDAVVSQDVFEHIPDYRRAFAEAARVLKPGGTLIFTIPFFHDLCNTRVRARVDAEGEVEHVLPPEFHGNPMSNQGSLCFQNFGWDLIDDLKAAGFMQSKAQMYWGPWAGHMGFPFFVFAASKG